MTPIIPPPMLKELRHQLASGISDAKAYDVPALCRRLNLADGTEQEAFASKYKYAQKRVAELAGTEVLASSRSLLAEEEHFALGEIVAKIDELTGTAVTTLTRRRLIALFEGRSLSTEIEEIELIRSVWPIGNIPAPIQGQGYTLEDDIHRFTVRNDDLTRRELLEMLGLLTCSRTLLFKFLVAVTAPEAQSTDRQAALATSIDELLRKDDYTLALAERSLAALIMPSCRCPGGLQPTLGFQLR